MTATVSGGSGASAATAVCSGTDVAIGGGGNTSEGDPDDDDLTLSAPVSGTLAAGSRPLAANGATPTGWRVQYPDASTSSGGTTATVYAICVPATS
ncbi:MAG TPA: hypothetical protein VNP96_12915 [Solirubrobacterales bacterium]|nr:hypothetical protein [Solirubrobacterales bacterium]